MCNTSLIRIHKIDDPFFSFSFLQSVSSGFDLSNFLGCWNILVSDFQTFVVPGVPWTDFDFLLRVNLLILYSPASILC